MSGTKCLDYTKKFLKTESEYRTEGNINYKQYPFLPTISPEVLRLARTLANSSNLKNILPTFFRKKRVLLKDDVKVKDENAIKTIKDECQCEHTKCETVNPTWFFSLIIDNYEIIKKYFP